MAKTGTGKLTLSGASTYTGATTVSQGILSVTGSLDNTALTVASGATLMGNGSIGNATTKTGSVTLQSGGIHAPGNSPGVQTVNGNLTYQDGSIFAWDIDRTKDQATRGTGYDAVNVSGTLAGLDGTDANGTTDAIFRIVIGDAGFTDNFWTKSNHTWSDIFTDGTNAKSGWASIFGGGFQYYKTDGTSLSVPTTGSFSMANNTLTWTAVPEPSSALAGLLLGAGLLRRRR